MKEEDLVDLKAAMALAEETGDYSALNKMVRPSGTPEPTELSIRDRNVYAEELAAAEEALIAIKEGDDYAAIVEAKEIVQVLRAAHREGEIEAGRRSPGVGILTEEGN